MSYYVDHLTVVVYYVGQVKIRWLYRASCLLGCSSGNLFSRMNNDDHVTFFRSDSINSEHQGLEATVKLIGYLRSHGAHERIISAIVECIKINPE